MNKEKLSPSIICIIVLLIAFTVISSYLLIRINTLLRTYSLVGDHYELSVISAKNVSLDSIEQENKELSIVPIGETSNYKIEFIDGKAFITVLSQNGCRRLFDDIDDIKLSENEKVEIKGFHSNVVYAYIDYESLNRDIYFLMDDGLLEHVSLKELLTSDETKTNGILPGIKHVVNVLPGKTDNGHVLIALTSDKGYVVLNTLVN